MLRPTIEDVARIAGVSIATVSRCLHRPEVVSVLTRDRVLDAVKQTGYTLNTAAQGLRQRRSNTVLVVVPDIGNTFFSEVLSGVEAVARAAGLTMLIGDTGFDRDREASLVRYLVNGRADGALLLVEPMEDWFDLRAANAKGVTPVVMISEPGPQPGAVSVSIDNEAAAHAAVRHLIDAGHSRIAHLSGPEGTGLTELRLRGYARALSDAGLTFDPGMVLPGDFGLDSGRAAFARFAALPGAPTAIFCANDESAMGFVAAAHQAGVRVPQDVSVVGFDDIHFAQGFIPALTTVRQPRAEMGAAAMRLLLAILSNESPAPVCLPWDLVIRDSTARLS
jgi:LacI family repressor for deo operon, udp, cdd, tsx, nupC, and nupG